MSTKKGIHFEVSERKLLLRAFDILFVFLALYTIGNIFHFDYFTITKENWTWSLVLAVYILVFGSVFELYHLKRASKLDVTFKNIILTTSVTVLFYLLTPVITPFLPEKRIQIIYFYLTIIIAIFIWRFLYITFIESPRFFKKGIIIGSPENAKSIINILDKHDQNYKIVGFVNSEPQNLLDLKEKQIKTFKIESISEVIQEENVSELIVAIENPETITPDIYNKLTDLLEGGFKIKEYSQLFEDLSKRVPVHFVGKDFYRYFPFSRSNKNKLYMFFHRLFDIALSSIGIVLGIVMLPIILLGNLLGNRGKLFYAQERVGQNGVPFKIYKFRTMVKDAESNG
ncbi:MAG: sugar transferase, partial [Bacteroidia bacterium]|nr:sugar transferase [Bacteroidia bacterium]